MIETIPFKALLAIAAAVMGLFALAPSAWAAPSSVPDEGTAQVDGSVYTVLAVSNRVYLGGDFTHVNGIARSHLAALDATTGQLTDWAPSANGPVRTLVASPNGSLIYAGGDFTGVSGASRNHLVALRADTGAVLSGWRPRTDGSVYALAVSGRRLYVGGAFTTVNGRNRTRLALVSRRTGKLSRSWTPRANGTVRTLVPSKDGSSIYAGGLFSSISGKARPYLAALSATTGNLRSTWQPPTPNGPVFDLALSGTRVYAAEGGPGGAVAAYDASTGAEAWSQLADGDLEAVTVLDGKVYVGGHFSTLAGQSRSTFAAVDGATGALDEQWSPDGEPSYPGVLALDADAARTRLYAGGAFSSVSGQPHQGFAQFS